uniref:Uncharacterized protein n=1 Tax=Opuntia streptacantha TaxID=393608 RepID=A0A7C9A2W8_OPUST
MYPKRIPKFIKISGKDVKDPLAIAGAISAMYTGAIMTPKPIPIPASSRPVSNTLKLGAKAIMAAPAWKTPAANAIVHFLPIASDVFPPAKLPNNEIMLRMPTRTSI